jgi:hypothetical protein
LGAFIGGSDVKVRFHFHSDGGYEVDGIYFDDFEINTSDVDDSPPFIGYDNPPVFFEGVLEDYIIYADLIDVSGIASSSVMYKVDDGDWSSAAGENTVDDEYMFTIPSQDPGSLVEFHLEATDASDNSNTSNSDNYQYISGAYWSYDDPEVAFFTNLMAGDGAAVRFSLPNSVQVVTGLIRNYEDQSTPPNKPFMFHVWDEGDGGPGNDMITPFSVTPSPTLIGSNPMTIVDLRDFEDELSSISGDIYIGLTVEEDTVKITLATLAANRSFALGPNGWGAATSDFQFRLVTSSTITGISQVENSVVSAIVFPNPASDVLFIESNSSKIKTIKVVNVAGNIVLENKVHAEKTQIEISSFSKGVYFVQVETENGITTKKIIVK